MNSDTEDVTEYVKVFDDNWLGNQVQVILSNSTGALTAYKVQKVGGVNKNVYDAEKSKYPEAQYDFTFNATQPSVNGAKLTIKKNSNNKILQWKDPVTKANQDVMKIETDANGNAQIRLIYCPNSKTLVNWASNPTDASPLAHLLYCNVDLTAKYDCYTIGTEAIHVRFLRPVDVSNASTGELQDGVPTGDPLPLGHVLSGATDWQGYKIFSFVPAKEASGTDPAVPASFSYGEYVNTVLNKTIKWYKYYGFETVNIKAADILTNQFNTSITDPAKAKTLAEVNGNMKVCFVKTSDPDTELDEVNENISTDLSALLEYVLVYKNNMGYTEDFKLFVPVTIEYSWGIWTGYVTIPVKGTKNNYQN